MNSEAVELAKEAVNSRLGLVVEWSEDDGLHTTVTP